MKENKLNTSLGKKFNNEVIELQIRKGILESPLLRFFTYNTRIETEFPIKLQAKTGGEQATNGLKRLFTANMPVEVNPSLLISVNGFEDHLESHLKNLTLSLLLLDYGPNPKNINEFNGLIYLCKGNISIKDYVKSDETIVAICGRKAYEKFIKTCVGPIRKVYERGIEYNLCTTEHGYDIQVYVDQFFDLIGKGNSMILSTLDNVTLVISEEAIKGPRKQYPGEPILCKYIDHYTETEDGGNKINMFVSCFSLELKHPCKTMYIEMP